MTDTSTILVLVFFYVLLVVAFLLLVWFLKATFVRVRQAEVMVIERFGKFHSILKPGIYILNPFCEKPRSVNWRYMEQLETDAPPTSMHIETDRIDLREHCIELSRQHVITRDTVQIGVSAVLYFQICDPTLAVYAIANLPDALTLLTQTTLRNTIAHITLDETFSSREMINQQLREKTSRDAERWGVNIVRAEVLSIFAPEDIRTAMQRQITEERERRSAVLRADGERESSIVASRGTAARIVLRAEGEKTAVMQRARGQADARVALAQADSQALSALRSALPPSVSAAAYSVALAYLASLRALASKANVTLMPADVLRQLATFEPAREPRVVK